MRRIIMDATAATALMGFAWMILVWGSVLAG